MTIQQRDDPNLVMTNLRAEFFLLAILLGLSVALALPTQSANSAYAQDPGGLQAPLKEPDLASLAATTPTIDPGLSESTRLVIRAVIEADPQTVMELSRAVKSLIDVEQYDVAKIYLAKLQLAAADDERLFEVYEALGSDFFLLLHGLDQPQPMARDFARKVLAAANREANQPERVNRLIQLLSSPDLSARSDAFRKLRKLGSPAIAEMMHVFTDASRRDEFPGVRAALKQMGSDAVPVLLGAARANQWQVQAEAIHALGFYPSEDATDVMMRTYLSPRLPESLRRVAHDSLIRTQQAPVEPALVEQRFYDKARAFLLGKRKLSDGVFGAVTLWQWNDSTQQLEPQTVSVATATRLAAAQRAADLYEINPDSPANRQMFLLTQLEATKFVLGPSLSVDAQRLVQLLEVDAMEINQVLAEAVRLKLVPAATASCEILGSIGSPEVLGGIAAHSSPLIQAMMLGDRHLQYAAFTAIDQLDPHQAYAGSSYMMMLAVFMARSDNQPAGLVGHVREDIARSYAATLGSAGLVGESANTGRGFFRKAIADPDLEILLISDTIDWPSSIELVQQLRNDFRTKQLPIGLLYRSSDSRLRVQRLVARDPLLISMPVSLEPAYVASQVQRLQDLVEPWTINSVDRRKHAVAAVSWLAKIAGDRNAYSFYDFGGYQEQLTQLLYLPGFVEAASEILVHLGTPAAQRELINFASQSGLPIEDRQKAAEAFGRAVQNGGTLLTKNEIRQQYDRYNASEGESVDSQQVLGAILDAIEARARTAN